MKTRRIILANESRLLREMIKRVIGKSSALKIVGEAHSHAEINTLVRDKDAHWVIVTLSSDGKIPQQTRELLFSNPNISVLGLTNGADQAIISWVDLHEEKFTDYSLDDMVHTLHEKAR